MHSNDFVARALSGAFLAGALEIDGLVDRGAQMLGRRWRWLRPLARHVCESFGGQTHPRQIVVTKFILHDVGFLRAAVKYDLRVGDRLAGTATMAPVAAASAWGVPPIRSPGELADWLGISIGDLDWLSDLRALGYKQNKGRLRNYNYRPLAGRFGKTRLIEAPKPRLKAIQRSILAGILNCIPLHPAVHGFRRGRSITTFASLHVDKRVVLRIDLEEFFPSISAARIQALFRTLGYPERVADLLAGLCTNSTPADIWNDGAIQLAPLQVRNAHWRYSRRHLPQGAPTSPALANLCAYRLDCRLSCLARSTGAIYTRYADDLAFSGDRRFERSVKRFQLHVCATAMEEGFSVNHRKTRVMRHGVRQRLAGIVVNKHVNVMRADFDRLKATLTNCVRHGAQSQNRTDCGDFQKHLLGRISFIEMVSPPRGNRLRKLFDQIKW